MATINDARAELVRSRAFIRGAETQLSKALAALDAIGAEPDPSTPEPEVPEPEAPTPEPEKPDPPFEVSLGGALLAWTPYPNAVGYRVGFVSVAGSQEQTLPATMTSVAIPDGSPAGEITVTVLLAAGDGPGDSVQWVPPAVPEPEPEPGPEPGPPVVVPPASGVQPSIVERFDYASTADLLADPRRQYVSYETISPARIKLDTAVLFNGHPTMRYDYPGGRVPEVMVSRLLAVPSNTLEVAVEWWLRWSANFDFDAGGAQKLLHLPVWPDTIGRFGVNVENGNAGGVNAEGPVDNYDAFYLRGPGVSTTEIRTGGWVPMRYHARLSGGRGTHRFWLGGKYAGSRTATTGAREIVGVALGKNINRTPQAASSMWFGEIRVWLTDPGW